MTRPISKNAPVLLASILPADEFGQPPDPSEPPLTDGDLARINIYVFEKRCDPWAAADQCGLSPAQLIAYLDQPHIARFVRKCRQAIHIHNFEIAALNTRQLAQHAASEPARLRAAATLIRAYTRAAPRPAAPRADDTPPTHPTPRTRRDTDPRSEEHPAATPHPAISAGSAARHVANAHHPAASPSNHAQHPPDTHAT